MINSICKKVSKCKSHFNHAETQLISRRKVAKMLIAIVILFVVCYLPVHTLFLLRSTGLLHLLDMNSPIIPLLYLVAHWLCYFNSAINPVIYNFMSMKFRAEFKCVFSCKPARRPRMYTGSTLVASRYHGVNTEMEPTINDQSLDQMDSV